jgi:anti-sigma factor RsiW
VTDHDDDVIEELLGAYALDAVDDEERARVETYLDANPHARAEVWRHREVAALLAVGTERPPEGLWDRIAGALEETPPAPGPLLAKVMPMDRAPARRRRGLLAGVAGGGGGGAPPRGPAVRLTCR